MSDTACNGKSAKWVGPIEKGVPIRAKALAMNVELRDRMTNMEIGDSFPTRQSQYAVYCMARNFGIKVVVRKIERGIRVWRTK